ncbi:Phycocyanobilin lyase subunit alpha [Thermoflexales bacterium]|nr:Phycocyanobilin lyase subunit alpha [Thermoflexales bacterium]
MPQPKVSDEELRKVVTALRHPSAEVRAAACFQLEAIRDPRTVEVLMSVLRNPREDALVRNAAAGALESIGGLAVVNKLIEVMREAKANDWLTVFSLAALGETAFNPLLAVLNDPKAKGRAHAATALGLIGNRRAVGALLHALQDGDSVLRSRAAAALGRLGDEQAFEGLVLALRDPKVHVRRDAMWALSELGDRRAVGLLIRSLRDPSRFIRQQAAECLGELGSPQALQELERLAAHDKNRCVARTARQAIDLLERQS